MNWGGGQGGGGSKKSERTGETKRERGAGRRERERKKETGETRRKGEREWSIEGECQRFSGKAHEISQKNDIPNKR